MNWVDLALLGLLTLSALAGLVRGLVREVLGVGAWVGAAAAAIYAFPTAQPFFRQQISNVDFADPAALGAVFLVTLIVLSIIGRLISNAVRGSGLGGLDRTLGVAFGVARGAAVAVLAYIVGGMAFPTSSWPEPVQSARTLPLVYQGAAWTAAQLPPGYRPAVPPPPAQRQATAASLLQREPQGRATARVVRQ